MIVSTGPEEQVLLVNTKFTDLFGYTIEDIPDVSSWWPLAYPDERYRQEIKFQWSARIAKAVKEKGEIEPLEATVTCKDGGKRDIQFSFSSIGDRNLVIFIDNTESKQAEEALKETAARLNEAQRIAHIGSWELDTVNNALTWSDEIYRIFEIDPKNFGASYDAFLDTIHPEDREAVNFAYTNSLKTRVPYTIEHRLLFSDGRIKYVHEQCETFYDAEGKPLRSVGIVQDITDRKKAEESIRSANAYNRSLIDASLDPLVTISRDGKITDVNQATEKITGYSREKLIGTNFADYFSEPEKARVGYQKVFKEGLVQDYQLGIRRLDGHVTPVLYNASLYKDDSGDIAGIFAAARDISELKKAEVELARVNLTLRMLSSSNQALIRITDEAVLLNEVCRIAVEVGSYCMAWVAYAEQDEVRTLRPMAHAGFDSGYIESARLTWADNERGRGPSGTAFRTGKPCLARNIHTDPSYAPWREEALRRGYQASISLPLVSEGRAFGVLSIYAAEPDAFDDNETEILNELASDLAFGITAIRMRAERKRAEQQLQDQHALLTAIMNSSREIIIFSLDKNYCYTAFNDKHRKEMKKVWDADISVGMNLLGCMTIPELRESAKQSIDRALQGEAFTEVQHQPEPDIYYELFWNPVVQNDSIVGVTVFTHDITENMRTADELRRASYKNEMVLNSAGEGIFGLDMEGRVTFVNPSAANMLDYKIEELLNCRSHETFHYQKADGTPHLAEQCTIYNAVAEGVPYREAEDVFQRKDATSIPVEYVITPMLENNKTVGGVVVFADITERRRAENTLRENQARLDLALRSADMGVWHWDIIENKRHFDDQACHLLGINPATFTGSAEEFFEAIHPDDRETIKAALARTMEQDVQYESEYRAVWPDESAHYISATSPSAGKRNRIYK
jgi:PAS domain S-box-containing protein